MLGCRICLHLWALKVRPLKLGCWRNNAFYIGKRMFMIFYNIIKKYSKRCEHVCSSSGGFSDPNLYRQILTEVAVSKFIRGGLCITQAVPYKKDSVL